MHFDLILEITIIIIFKIVYYYKTTHAEVNFSAKWVQWVVEDHCNHRHYYLISRLLSLYDLVFSFFPESLTEVSARFAVLPEDFLSHCDVFCLSVMFLLLDGVKKRVFLIVDFVWVLDSGFELAGVQNLPFSLSL